jgi:lysophospholipase L1-like esterase
MTRSAVALLVGTVAAFLLAETALRFGFGYHGLTPAQNIEYDRELGWTLTPARREWQSALDYGVWVTTDADGLRTDDRGGGATTGPPHPTLLILGDSFAFGYGVPADAMLASAIERELATTPTPYRVRTAGVPGYSTDQELLRWRRVAASVRPTRVLLLFHASDLVDNLRDSVVMGPERYFKPRYVLHGSALELTAVPVPWKQTRRSGAFERVKAFFRPSATYALIQMSLRRVGSPGTTEEVVQPEAISPQADRIAAALLTTLDREVRSVGAALTVALVPADLQVTARVAAICRASHLPLVDLGPAFAGRRDLLLPYDGHWNARGHAVAAHAIAASLR